MQIAKHDPDMPGPGNVAVIMNDHERARIKTMCGTIRVPDAPGYDVLDELLRGLADVVDEFMEVRPDGTPRKKQLYGSVVTPRVARYLLLLHQLRVMRVDPDADLLLALLELPDRQYQETYLLRDPDKGISRVDLVTVLNPDWTDRGDRVSAITDDIVETLASGDGPEDGFAEDIVDGLRMEGYDAGARNLWRADGDPE